MKKWSGSQTLILSKEIPRWIFFLSLISYCTYDKKSKIIQHRLNYFLVLFNLFYLRFDFIDLDIFEKAWFDYSKFANPQFPRNLSHLFRDRQFP